MYNQSKIHLIDQAYKEAKKITNDKEQLTEGISTPSFTYLE